MTSTSKSVYIDDTVNKYSNTCHKTIKMKPVDVNPGRFIVSVKENNKENPKF